MPLFAWVCDLAPVPIVVACMVGGLWFLNNQLMTGVSSSLLEHADFQQLKDTVKNLWNYTSLTSALLLTVAVPLLDMQINEHPPFGLSFNTDMQVFLELTPQERWMGVAHTTDDGDEINVNVYDQMRYIVSEMYTVFTLLSILFFLFSIFKCVVNLCYVEPLHNTDVVAYVLNSPNSVGEPTVDLMIASLMLLVAMMIWVTFQYGFSTGIVGVGMVLYFIVFMHFYITGKDEFTPKDRSQWDWSLKDPKAWPEWVHAREQKDRKVFQNMGEFLEKEEQKRGAWCPEHGKRIRSSSNLNGRSLAESSRNDDECSDDGHTSLLKGAQQKKWFC